MKRIFWEFFTFLGIGTVAAIHGGRDLWKSDFQEDSALWIAWCVFRLGFGSVVVIMCLKNIFKRLRK